MNYLYKIIITTMPSPLDITIAKYSKYFEKNNFCHSLSVNIRPELDFTNNEMVYLYRFLTLNEIGYVEANEYGSPLTVEELITVEKIEREFLPEVKRNKV